MTMTSKERMIHALQGQAADVVPAAWAYPSLYLENAERAAYVEQYRRRIGDAERYAIDHEEDTLFRARALHESYRTLEAQPDWIEVSQGASRAWAARTEIIRRGNELRYHDLESDRTEPMATAPVPWGDARLKATSASLTDLWDVDQAVQDEDDVDARLPVLSAEELLARGDFDLPRQLVADYGDEVFISTVLDTPFSNAYDLLGFQGLMTIQHDRPALFHQLLERELARAREEMAAWAAVGVHGVYVEEVFTGADLISPRSYDEFVYRYNQPYFRHMRSLGLLPIHYVCGDAIPRLDRIASLDIAAVAVEESKKAFTIEIEEVVERVAGRVVVFGNVDAVRFGLHATPEEMAAEVKRQARIGARARGFVVSTGSPFPLDTEPRQIDTLVATAHGIEPPS
jgi:uroporphyrinogen-III decarboxylase